MPSDIMPSDIKTTFTPTASTPSEYFASHINDTSVSNSVSKLKIVMCFTALSDLALIKLRDRLILNCDGTGNLFQK